MMEFQGIAVSQGISIHEAYVVDPQGPIAVRSIEKKDVELELKTLRESLQEAVGAIEHIQGLASVGPESRAIFKFHVMMLKDRTLIGEIEARIQDGLVSAESAVVDVFRSKADAMRALGDDVVFQRDKDLLDVKHRILQRLTGRKFNLLDHLARPVVVVSHDLTPSQTVSMPRRWVRGFITEAGGRTSHTALIARNLGIPAVVGLGPVMDRIAQGSLVIVDGGGGRVIVDPDDEVLALYRRRRVDFLSHEENIRTQLRALGAETADGYRVRMFANIEFPGEIPIALDHGAEGIGLFRTEFIWGQTPFPTLEDHLKVYKTALVHLKGRPLTIRTFDLGADKVFEGLPMQPEANPFLGLRSLRYCFKNIEMFRDQLKAILITSYMGPVKVLFPMVSSVEELDGALSILDAVKEEMADEGIDFDEDIEVGAMIEVPSAAIIAEKLARQVNFFSIGTNDLIQYTLAVDRTNETVATLYQPAHPAVLKLVSHIIEVGEKAGIEVTMCGEMAGDLRYAVLLLGMGLRQVSVAPAMISDIKGLIRNVTMARARLIWEEIQGCATATEAEARLEEYVRKLVPEDAHSALLGDVGPGIDKKEVDI